MKKILLISSLTLILLSHKSKAQSYNGHYSKMTTEHYKDNELTSKTDKYKSGEVVISPTVITIDGEAYSVLKSEKPEIADENYYTQCLTIVTKSKTGAYKVMDLIIELKPDKKTIDYVQLNKTKSTKVGYVLVNN